jgi:hypothetical protein
MGDIIQRRGSPQRGNRKYPISRQIERIVALIIVLSLWTGLDRRIVIAAVLRRLQALTPNPDEKQPRHWDLRTLRTEGSS